MACRLEKASYVEVAYSAPLTSKRKPGRPKNTASSLQRQDSELQTEEGVAYSSDSDTDDDVPLRLLISPPVNIVTITPTIAKKRGRPPKNKQDALLPAPIQEEQEVDALPVTSLAVRKSKRIKTK